MPIRISAFSDFSECRAYLTAWRRLLEESAVNTIYQTPEWLQSWWECYGGCDRLLLLLAFDQEELVGIAPLMRATRAAYGVRRRMIQFVGVENFASDYADFILPAGRADVLEAILEWLWRDKWWSILLLGNYPTHSVNYGRCLEFFQKKGALWLVQAVHQAPTCLLGDAATRRRVLNKKSLRRHFNYFHKNGELICRHLNSMEEIEEFLPRFFRQHIERWSATPYPSLFVDEKACRFYRLLARRLYEAGWLRFSVVLYNQKAIAFHFGFEYGGRFIWYKPSFDTIWSKRSPGEVLLKFLLEDAIVRGLDEFDFTVGGEAFKHRFANLTRTNAEIAVHRSLCLYLLKSWRMRMARMLGRFSAGCFQRNRRQEGCHRLGAI